MAIPIKPEKGEGVTTQELDSNYTFYEIPNIPNTSSNFILDMNTGQWYSFDSEEGAYVSYKTPDDNPYEDADFSSLLIPNFLNTISNHIFNTTSSLGYESPLDLLSYYNSLDEQKRAEAKAFLDWRDSVLFVANLNIDAFESFGATLPDLDGFTSQPEYVEFEVKPLLQTFSGNEIAGYQILDTREKTFFGWSNIQHTDDLNGNGIGELINSGNIKNIYSVSCSIDQNNLTGSWGTDDYTVKIKFNGDPNDYGVLTDFEYKIGNSSEIFSGFSGLMVRVNYMGKFA